MSQLGLPQQMAQHVLSVCSACAQHVLSGFSFCLGELAWPKWAAAWFEHCGGGDGKREFRALKYWFLRYIVEKVGNGEDQICLSAVEIRSITCDFNIITRSLLWSKGKQKSGPLISIELPFNGFTPV